MTSKKKVALITGANKGLGKEIARQLGRQGITVLLGARDIAKGKAVADELQKEGIDAHGIQLDVTNPLDIQALPAIIESQWGGLDILVNNAGVSLEWANRDQPMPKPSEVPLETIRAVYETNFFAVIRLTQTLLPILRRSQAGRIVNHSSILGSLTVHSDPTNPVGDFKALAYNSSKTALNAFTVHLAYELKGSTLKVNSAHPGWVKTDLGTEAAPMEVVDGAKTAVWLATLPADGPSGGFFHNGKPLPW
jgi:NAD(P)-dependent dehydrogenase (short-subunit alcohol dehydrogenase family)